MKIDTRLLAAALATVVCGCVNDSTLPLAPITRPSSVAAGSVGRHTVVVNPDASGAGVAATIQEGLDMVADGGTVRVMPGTYDEKILIDRGLTLTSIAGGKGPVIIRHSQTTAALATDAVIIIRTASPVTLRDISLVHDNLRGVNILRDADVVVERVAFSGVSTTTPAVGNGVTAHYNAGTSGRRARVTVRDSRFSVGGIAVSFGGDVDGVIERNEVRHGASRQICVNVNPVGQGGTTLATPGTATNVDIIDNLFESCGTNVVGRFGSVNVLGSPGATTGGTVNVVGNIVRDAAPAGCIGTGIQYEHYTGVIEHNTIVGVMQGCAPAVTTRGFRSAVFVGTRIAGIRAANVAVRFNDIADNEHAGLRLGPNQPVPIDATCNWWGSAGGPSSVGPTEQRDAIVVQAGGAVPSFAPFATAPVARAEGGACR